MAYLLRCELVREGQRKEQLARSREPAISPADPAADGGAQGVPDRVEDPLCELLGRVGLQLVTPLRPMQAHGEPPCQVATPIVEGRAYERNESGARERRPEEQKGRRRRSARSVHRCAPELAPQGGHKRKEHEKQRTRGPAADDP